MKTEKQLLQFFFVSTDKRLWTYLVSGLAVTRPQADRLVQIGFASGTVQTIGGWKSQISNLTSLNPRVTTRQEATII